LQTTNAIKGLSKKNIEANRIFGLKLIILMPERIRKDK